MRLMLVLFALSGAVATTSAAQATQPLSIRGHVQWLHLYGAGAGSRSSCPAATAGGFTSARTSPRCWRREAASSSGST